MAYSGREREEAESERKMEGKEVPSKPRVDGLLSGLEPLGRGGPNPGSLVGRAACPSESPAGACDPSARLQRPPQTPSGGASAARFSGAPRLRKLPRFMFFRHGWVHLVLKKSLIFAPPNCGMLLLAPLSFA